MSCQVLCLSNPTRCPGHTGQPCVSAEDAKVSGTNSEFHDFLYPPCPLLSRGGAGGPQTATGPPLSPHYRSQGTGRQGHDLSLGPKTSKDLAISASHFTVHTACPRHQTLSFSQMLSHCVPLAVSKTEAHGDEVTEQDDTARKRQAGEGWRGRST